MNVNRPASGLQALLGSLHCDGRRGLTLLALGALLLVPELAGDTVRLALRYERGSIAAGEWWRLVTGHLVHLDAEHAVLNLLGLLLMWALFARDYRAWQWLVVVTTCIAAIDAGLWMRDSTLEWYVGSSGVLHGVMAAGTIAHLRRREPDAWLLAVFLVAKLLYEQRAGSLPLAAAGVPVVVNAHLYGAIAGAAVAVILKSRREPL